MQASKWRSKEYHFLSQYAKPSKIGYSIMKIGNKEFHAYYEESYISTTIAYDRNKDPVNWNFDK